MNPKRSSRGESEARTCGSLSSSSGATTAPFQLTARPHLVSYLPLISRHMTHKSQRQTSSR